MGHVTAIYIGPRQAEPMQAVDEVKVIDGRGLDGDRYCEGEGTFSRTEGSGRHITLIESEAVEAGCDLYAASGVSLAPGARATVGTGIAVAIPDGHVGLTTPRSGLAASKGLSLVNAPGVIDAGYRGEIKVILVNHGDECIDIA